MIGTETEGLRYAPLALFRLGPTGASEPLKGERVRGGVSFSRGTASPSLELARVNQRATVAKWM